MKQNTFNQTAYRILLLLRWLIEEPLTFAEINARFLSEPKIQKTVSQDTLGLYLNTLRALGCEVSRPAPRNGYKYDLIYHPFTYFLTSQDIGTLKETLRHLDDQLPLMDTLRFNLWLDKMFRLAANKNRAELSELFMYDTRIINFDTLESSIHQLSAYCQEEQLVEVFYHSAGDGIKKIDFLPYKITHSQGTFYLVGQSADKSNTSMLRIDKITDVRPSNNDQLLHVLQEKRLQKQEFVIRLCFVSPRDYIPFQEDEEIIPDPQSADHFIVKLTTDNEFALWQKLLSSGYLFQVLSPESFKNDLESTLTEMRRMYV